jgi:hypothetical protein
MICSTICRIWRRLNVHHGRHDAVGTYWPAVSVCSGRIYGIAGHRPEWVPHLHAACDVGASVCIFFVGRRLFGSWIGASRRRPCFSSGLWTADPGSGRESVDTADERLVVGHGCLPFLLNVLRGSWFTGRTRHSVQAGDNPACRCAGRSIVPRHRSLSRQDGSCEPLSVLRVSLVLP